MEDQLITFETAKISKEKGFSQPTTFEYLNGEVVNRRDYIPHDYNIRGLMSAPTQSHLQKWLREKHNILVYLLWYNDIKEPRWSVYAHLKHEKGIAPSAGGYIGGYESYEEGLEAGLQHALKLIK